MQSNRSKHYLSPGYQEGQVQEIFANVRMILSKYLEKKKSTTSDSNLTLKNLENLLSQKKSVSKKQCIDSLLEDIHRLSRSYLKMIRETPKAHNEYLLAYIAEVCAKLMIAESIIRTIENESRPGLFGKSTLPNILSGLLKTCRLQSAYLERAIDIGIYQVIIPNAEYMKIYEESKYFHDESMTKVTGKTIAGSVGFIPSAFVTAALVFGAVVEGHGDPEAIEAATKTSIACIKGVKKASDYGFSCKTSIPPEWINAEEDSESPYCQTSTMKPEERQVIYLLDARDPKVVFLEGINYHGIGNPDINRHGHVIFFHNLDDAKRCALSRKDGLLYDEVAGWRLHKPWEKEELAAVYSDVQNQQLVRVHTSQPAVEDKKAAVGQQDPSSQGTEQPESELVTLHGHSHTQKPT